MELKDVRDPTQWHIAFALAGLAITVAAVAVHEKPIVVVGIGLMLFGLGEMKNHPYHEWVYVNDFGTPQMKGTGHPRLPSLLGLALDAIGIALFVAGLWWYVAE